MPPPNELLDIGPVLGNAKHFLQSSIPPDETVERVVLPPPEMGCVEGKLQTIFARLQGLRVPPALDCKAHPGNEGHVEKHHHRIHEECQHVTRLFNVERQAGWKHKKRSRSNAEHHGKKPGTHPGKERDERKALNIRINGQPQGRGNPNGHESEQVGPNGSRPEHGNVDVN